MQFRAVCSKGNKKMTLSLVASNKEEARSILHKQGYSIIELQEISDESLLQKGNFFYFEISVNGAIQTGKIQSDDIFRAYKKLVEDLKYEVVYIYTLPNMPEDQKRIITAKVKDGYNMYLESIGAKNTEKSVNILQSEEDLIISPQVLKELEKYNVIIDETITKIQNLLIKNHNIISPEQKDFLEKIENELVQLKGGKNIAKIQSDLEEALKKIGSIELEILKKGMIEEKKKFLAETNKLLQGVGSSDRIQTEEEKQKDIGYQLSSLLGKISSKKTKNDSEISKIDTNSFIYFKNKRELDIYKKTLQKNDLLLFKALVSFKFSLFKRLILKRRLLKQNIQIIENRISNKVISYSKIAHGFEYYIDAFFRFFDIMGTIFSLAIFVYIFVYIFAASLSNMNIIHFELSQKSPFFLTLFSLFALFLVFIRGWKTMVFGFVLFCLIASFLSLNF